MRREFVVAAAMGGAFATVLFAAVDDARPDAYVVTAKTLSAERAISADSDGWTYSIPMDVAWQDVRGRRHDGGRPECLPPSGKEEGPIRFKALPVEAGGVKFRQVIYVGCMR